MVVSGGGGDVLISQLSKITFYYPVTSRIKARLTFCNRWNVSNGGGGKGISRNTLMYIVNITKTYFNRKDFDSLMTSTSCPYDLLPKGLTHSSRRGKLYKALVLWYFVNTRSSKKLFVCTRCSKTHLECSTRSVSTQKCKSAPLSFTRL